MDIGIIDGTVLLRTFKVCLDLQFEKSIVESPSSIGRPGETKLVSMLDLYDGPHQSEILRLVGPFMRSLKKRHQVVLNSHNIYFARGSDATKLRVCYRCGESFSLNEFDLADLKSILYTIPTGAKVSPMILDDLSINLYPFST